MVVGDQGVPFRVDVEFHCLYRAGVLEDLRKGDHCLVVGGDEDQVAVTVDAQTGTPDESDVP
jgi:hypothetical protein